MSEKKTYYTLDGEDAEMAPQLLGVTEDIKFTGGKLSTDNPPWLAFLDGLVEKGSLTLKAPAKKEK